MPKRKRSKKVLQTAPSVIDEAVSSSSEIEEEAEDLDFLRDSLAEGRASFLKSMRLPGEQRQSGKSKSAKHSNMTDDDKLLRRQTGSLDKDLDEMESGKEEAKFEAAPRPSKWGGSEQEDLHYLLPLKGKHGRLIQQKPTVISATAADDKGDNSLDEEDEETVEPDSHDQNETESATKVLTTAELFVQRQQKLTEKKELIAEVAMFVIENPEEHIDKLKKLRVLSSERDPDVAITIRKVAMVSLMTVLKDIAPSYHIRELTETEKAVKVSKDVRRLRNFEQTLLMDYQLFLTLLDDTVKIGLGECLGNKKKKRRERKKPLAELDNGQVLHQQSLKNLARVALKCMCDLLVSLPHFNFRNNILNVLVPRMNSKALDGEVSRQCCEAIEMLFDNDAVGEVSFEAVQLIVKMVKAKSYKTKSAVLRTFLHLQLHSIDNPVAAAGSRLGSSKEERRKEKEIKMTNKRKRRLRAEAKLDRDLREAQAVENKEYKCKLQTEILKLVFMIYFRILKHSRHSPLLQPVLEGLAKFAHLINVDFFSDLMSVLHSLAETGGLSNRECMQCVLAAFEILSGQGAALQIDPRQFYTQLYGAITHLDLLSADRDVKLAIECLDCMMRKRRQISIERVLGFVKRLSTVSSQLLPGACLAVMATIKRFVQTYSQCEQLLNVEDSAGGGVFRPDVPDPEMSHASSTAIWELSLFKDHYHPVVQSYAGFLLIGAPSQGKGSLQPGLSRKSPVELLTEHSLDDIAHVTQPFTAVTPPPPHPATKRAQKKKKGWTDYYYRNDGISIPQLRELERDALEVADSVLLLTS